VLRRSALVVTVLVGATIVPALRAPAASALRVTSTLTTALTTSMPVLRLRFSAPVDARSLPRLTVRPPVATAWQQIGTNEVQAVARGRLSPLIRYVVNVPTAVSCRARCTFVRVSARATGVSANPLWEQQLLAELHYLPLSFSPSVPAGNAAQPVAGTFTWAYPRLPADLVGEWQAGQDNVIATGALMAFQDVHHLATTGVADATTWDDLIAAAESGQVDPRPYDYVDVSEGSPESLTLYVAGVPRFHALVNTGISIDPTQPGTYPVYLRFVNTIMKGTNPDGTLYADPVSWVSYFHGGDALHQFYRSSYGWPQSLGCVEMALGDAKYVWPYTPIGTLVTVDAT
jgi:lipoprotein-anchoring transpeptidase ErfK/SrfK